MHAKSWRGVVTLVTLLIIGTAGAALAQDTGNIFGTVSDTDGAALPGVTVTLVGFGATQLQVTDSNGGFRFLGLDPGSWSVKAELEGFSTVEYPNVVVSINRNTEILLTLSGAVEEASENITAGESLASPLEKSGHFPQTVVEMISVAEESNSLDTVLIDIADGLEVRTSRRLDLAVRMLEPMMLLLMAGVVLFIVIALLLPVIRMSSAIG